MQLEDLVGLHELTGCDSGVLRSDENGAANSLLFTLDGKTYRVTEDENDGYRSSMRDIEEVGGETLANTFPAVHVLGRMRSQGHSGSCDIIQFINVETGKIVLEVGTEDSDDYYPSFVADFRPEHMVSPSDRSKA